MSTVKKYLATAKIAIDKKDFENGREHCLSALEQDPKSFNALILLGFCETGLSSLNAAEKAYLEATAIKPESSFGWQGLLNVYEKGARVPEYLDVVKRLITIYKYEDDIIRCASMANKMRTFVSDKGSRQDKIEMLKFLLPDTTVFSFIEGRIPHPAETLQKLTELIESQDKETIQNAINKNRNKIGVNHAEVASKIKLKVYESSELEYYYRQLLNWSDDENQRREIEGKLLEFLYNKLLSVPFGSKDPIRGKIFELATGMLVVNSPVEHAWIIALEWQDLSDLSQLDHNRLRDYIALFPDVGLSKVIQAFLKSDISPFQQSYTTDTENGEDFIVSETWDETEILGNFIDGYEMRPDSVLANRILGHYYIHLGEYENAAELALAGLKLLDSVYRDTGLYLQLYKDAISVTLGTAYIYYQAPRHFNEALDIFNEVLNHSPGNNQALIGKALIYEESGNVKDSLILLTRIVQEDPDNVQALLEASWCRILLGDHIDGRNGLQKCLKLITRDDPSSQNLRAKIWWRIGKSLWDDHVSKRGDRSGAYNAFITSLKYNPNYAASYTSLGIFYADVEQDEDRAGKCFHKSFELDATQGEAARRLVETFADSQEWDLVEVIAARFADAERKRNVPGKEASWPYRVLGVAYVQSHDLVRAIQSFQSALRINDQDANSWTGLGEAYAESGRYVASSKAFARACNIDPDNWYSRFLLGMVHRQILSYDEAKKTFRSVLEVRSEEVVVLEHLCETLVASARDNINRNYYGQAIDDAIEALDISAKLAIIHPNSFNVWKNVGDAIQVFLEIKSQLGRLPIKVLTELFAADIANDDASVLEAVNELDRISLNALTFLDTTDIYLMASFFHLLAYKFSLLSTYKNVRSRGAGWFNIGCAELRVYLHMERNIRYRDAAINCFKQAIRLEPKNAEFWNAYGIATADYVPLVSQHAFIRSLVIDYRQASTWANLGVLYLTQGDMELANLSFNRAQSSDPDLLTSWIGQGIVAAAVGEDEEARELFEHSFAISNGSSKLAKLLYAASAFALFASISESLLTPMHVEIPIFALEKVLQLEPDFVPAMHYEGLMLERQGNYEIAIDRLNKASDILEQQYEDLEFFEQLKEFVSVRAQLARLYLSQKNFNASLETALTVIDLSEGEERLRLARLSALIAAGLSYYSLRDFTNALKMFRLASTDSERDPDITVLLSQVLYALGGTNRETAQDELFRNIEEHPQHLKSLLLLGTIGLVDGNEEVVDAIEAEINEFAIEQRISTSNDRSIELLLSGLEGSRTGQPSLRPWLQSSMLKPSDFKIWKYLDRKIAIETALLDPSIPAKDLSDVYASIGKFNDSLKAIFIYPGNKNAWTSLDICVSSDRLESDFKSLRI
ncbi:hypothetical protein V1520DRAFT_340134 [Lipomyces starkeyi]|uniref:Superkiller protein 3 n=1 Tax=Lipomyces starkeyi NRRL Y-11557 TaxID=675824 RepID=A0A1E3PZH6_LIPST|nr:hypothetical protein LIPSTDRAFT_74217 [Lipomyces starkeyi NRRL Y-11557]